MAAPASAARAGQPVKLTQKDASSGVQAMVETLRTRLQLSAVVHVQLVEQDVRLASVRADARTPGAFVLTLQRDLLARLSSDQLEAALAHELGHVWISTHHPYLQTEQLANRIAMRLVARERLVDVYQLVWGADMLHGSFERFLGLEPTVATATQQQ